MILIDGHLDLAMNALLWNRDLKLSVATTREQEKGMTQKGRGAGTVSFPELRKGEIAISMATVLARMNPNGGSQIDYRAPEISYASAQGQLAYYRELERQGVVRMIGDRATLDNHMAEWRRDPENTPFGIILTMEGADPIVEPAQVDAWWDDGLRVLSLAHYGPSAYAYGTGSDGPLTDMGRELLDRMKNTKMILDVTHLCDTSFWEAVKRFDGPLIATHSNCRALVPDGRQFTDEQLKLLIERDAVIGAVLDAWMLYPGWIRGETKPDVVALEAVADHIDHISQLAGNTHHSAIGSDLDGGYGTEQVPRDLDTIADLQKLVAILSSRGYTTADIEAIFHGNWLRVYERVWD